MKVDDTIPPLKNCVSFKGVNRPIIMMYMYATPRKVKLVKIYREILFKTCGLHHLFASGGTVDASNPANYIVCLKPCKW